jgi:acyl phosphate:glycerol-3-phosphate acyltransferase
MTLVLSFSFGYMLGSIPFGLILSLATGGPDVRTIGSGNIGATNVLRTGRKAVAAATLVCDTLKGTAAVLVTALYVDHYSIPAGGHYAIAAAAIGAFVGHLFPIWLKFKGGKGVATYLGLLLGIYWPSAVIFCAVWAAVAALSRFSSLAALVASALTPFVLWLLSAPETATLFLGLTILLWIMHRDNIARLTSGREDKIDIKTAPPA